MPLEGYGQFESHSLVDPPMHRLFVAVRARLARGSKEFQNGTDWGDNVLPTGYKRLRVRNDQVYNLRESIKFKRFLRFIV